ncbi:hypothetical protein BH11MYX3_BH11MYX3_37000 [soil metagenome]
MFDGGTTQSADAHAVLVRERDWIQLHEEISSVGKQLICLEAHEVDLLLEAEETKLYRRMGFPTIYAYIEAVLQYSHHVATERIRVAHELLELPGIADQFRAGYLPWTSVRELTRVATMKTEGAWLDAVVGKRSPEVQQMVRGKSKGDLPSDPVDPKKIKHRVVFEDVSEEVYQLHKQARIRAGSVTDDELLRSYATTSLEPVATDDPGRPRYQRATTTCRACKQSQWVGAGMEVPMTPQDAERVSCDADHIGDVELDVVERLASEIPLGTRRKVFVRDRFQCAVPGCRSCRYLEVHHIVRRADGGDHRMSRLLLLCDGHHKLLHDGVLAIHGDAPDRLVFELTVGADAN